MFKDYKDIDLSLFEYRDEELAKIYRRHCVGDFIYRSSDLFHSHKVFYLVTECISKNIEFFNQNNYDIEKIQIMALIHDDIEMLIGDFQAYKKDFISQEKLEEKENREKNAINTLSSRFPKYISKYIYKELLNEIEDKHTFESQFVKYFDHIDGICERFHECYGKNEFLLDIPLDDEGIKLPGGQRHYLPKISNPQKYYSLITDYLNLIGFDYNIDLYDEAEIIKNSQRHSKHSIMKSKGHKIYDWWIQTLLKRLDDEEIKFMLDESNLRFCNKCNYR